MFEKVESSITNKILSALPEFEYQRLKPHLEEVFFSRGQILQEPNKLIQEVYFPNKTIISLVLIMSDGSATEIGLVGNEGMVGLSAVLGRENTTSRSIVQISGSAMKLPAQVLQQEFKKAGKLKQLLLLYTQVLLTQVTQSAACNRQHSIEKRLARWLLSVQDCILDSKLPLTHESIAHILGTDSFSIIKATEKLQKAGIIHYNESHITILDHKALNATSCECYRSVQNEVSKLLGSYRV